MNNFERYLHSCVGKTIASVKPYAVTEAGDEGTCVTFTDDTTLTFYADDDELCINERLYTFTVNYSGLRHELIVCDKDGILVFSLQDDNLPPYIRHMTTDGRYQWVLDTQWNVLSDYDLV